MKCLLGWTFLFLVGWFYAATYFPSDFGWHFKLGEEIMAQGFPLTDLWTYTMPSYPFVTHSWWQDVLWAWIFPRFGFVGLGFIYASLLVLTLRLLVPSLRTWSFFLILLSLLLILPRFAIKTAVVDWFFLACLLRLTQDRSLWLRWRPILPLLFWGWANLHGGFLLGLVLLGGFLGWELISRRKIYWFDWLVLVFSFGSTFITPYRERIWELVLKTLFFNNNQYAILEWQSFLHLFEPAWVIIGVLTLVLVWRFKAILTGWQVVVLLIFFLSSLLSLRWGALFALVFLWVFSNLDQRLSLSPLSRLRLDRVSLLLLLLMFGWVGWRVYERWQAQAYWGEGRYPAQAVAWLQKNQTSGHLFSHYSWGGYLIYKWPAQKVFVDGRMDSWTRTAAPVGESLDAFAENYQIATGGPYQEIFDKYCVSSVLWPITPATSRSTSDKFVDLLGFQAVPSPTLGLLSTLSRDPSFREVYKDEISVIYRREVACDPIKVTFRK